MGQELHLKIYLDLRMPSIPDCSLIVAHLAAHIYVPTDTVATGMIRVICNLQCYVYRSVMFTPNCDFPFELLFRCFVDCSCKTQYLFIRPECRLIQDGADLILPLFVQLRKEKLLDWTLCRAYGHRLSAVIWLSI